MNIENKKAYHNFFIIEQLECGIELKGQEVKSIRNGAANIKDAYCNITQNNELVILGMHIAKYHNAFAYDSIDLDEKRERKLLANKSEIKKLASQKTEKGMTLVPLKIYFKNGRCKVLIGVGKGKKNYDKRNTLKERDVKRDIARSLAN